MTARTLTTHETTNVTMTTTAETVVATLSGVSTPRAVRVSLHGWAQVTLGTAATAVTPRIRRGTTVSGTLIGEGNPVQIASAAGTTEEISIDVVDSGADLAGASYVLTLEQTAATGDGTSLQATLTANVPE